MSENRTAYVKASVDEGFGVAIAMLGVAAAIVIGYVWGGFVFSVLWAWFIVTTFAAPVLGIAQSIGVLMVVGFAAKPRNLKKDDDTSPGKAMLVALAVPLLFLAVGWIVKQWLPT